MDLSNLEKIKGAKKSKKIVGRGIGSGKGGHTVGRGQKGQKARKGHKNAHPGFEGGQTPLYKRLPQIGGFRNPTTKDIVSLSLSRLNTLADGTTVDCELLVKEGIIKKLGKRTQVKFIGNSKLKKKLTLKGFLYSSRAEEEVKKSGSEVNE
jgi:large subunit ribosomal protein L15